MLFQRCYYSSSLFFLSGCSTQTQYTDSTDKIEKQNKSIESEDLFNKKIECKKTIKKH